MKRIFVILTVLVVAVMVFPTSMVAADAPIDYTPPITIKDYGDPYYTDGVNEWITADTPISLTATDEGSGVAYTEYRVWYNGEWTDWLPYTGPFTMGEIGIGRTCLHKIEFYSVDLAGNVEWWQEVVVEADAAQFEAYSAIAVDPFALHTTHMAYTEEASQDLVYEISSDFGETWTGKTVLADDLVEASEPDIQIAPNGDIHIVFIGYLTEPQQRISHIWYDFAANGDSYNNVIDPTSWEGRVLVDDTGSNNVYPQIAIDSLNNVHCVWIGDSDVFDLGAQDIFYSSFDGSGWSPRITLYASATTTPGSPNPQIIADCYDSLHVVFLDGNENKMKYLTYYVPLEFITKSNGEKQPDEPEWGSYNGGSWSPGVADNVGNSSASHGTVAGIAIDGDILHIAWQDVRGGDGEVYENTRDLSTTDAFGPEWPITFEQFLDDDGTTVGETLMGSGKCDNLHLFYRDSVSYDIWYMEYDSAWTAPVVAADSGPDHMHQCSEMAVDEWDGSLLTYTKVIDDYTEYDICYRKPYHNQLVRVDNQPPTTTKQVTDTTVTLDAKDNCHCEKLAILVSGPDGDVQISAQNDIKQMEEMLKQKCKETGGWQITKLTAGATDPKGNATKQNIEDAFKKVQERGDKCCHLFFYYSGHGSGYHKDDGYGGGRINTNCTSESGESYDEDDFKIEMTAEEWNNLAEGEGYLYDTDGDGTDDMWFGKDGGKAVLYRLNPNVKIGEDSDGDHDIDGADGGADLNGDGDKNDTFCVDEDLSVVGPSIYDDDFAQYMKWVCKCKNVTVVLDCCFSGGFINDTVRENPTKPMEIVTAAPQDDYSYSNGAKWGYYNYHLTAELKKCLSVEQAHANAIKKIQQLRKTKPWLPMPPTGYDSDTTEDKFLYCCGVGSYEIHYKVWYGETLGLEGVGELNQPLSFELPGFEECIIEYWAVDDLGNEEEHNFQPHGGDYDPPFNVSSYPKISTGEQNPDETYPVTITDSLSDDGSGVKQVVAKVDGTVEFEADDIGLPEYEFTFTVDLPAGGHTLTIDACDYSDNCLHKEEMFRVGEGVIGGTTLPTDKLGLMMPWIMATGALIVLGGVSLAIWNRKRGKEGALGR